MLISPNAFAQAVEARMTWDDIGDCFGIPGESARHLSYRLGCRSNRRRPPMTPDMRNSVERCLRSGMTYAEVAAECGVSRSAVQRVAVRVGWAKKPGGGK